MNRAPRYAEDSREILDPAVIADPRTLHARLRREAPLARIGDTGVHTVASWALIEEALGREADFSAHLTGVLHSTANGEPAVFELPSTGATDVIATADEPDHGVHRALAQPRLDARRIARMEPLVRRWTREALAPWLEAGGGDVVPIAERVPALAVAHVLGLPETDVSRFRVWAMMGGDMLSGQADAARLGFLARETAAMAAYLEEHFERAAADPDPDPGAPLLHALALGVASGRIPRMAAIGIAIVMFGAGGESTAALLGSALRVLAESPELAERLRSEPALVPRFVEEIVRLEPPFNFHYRVVRRACRLGGYDLAKGDRLMLLWASANRDPAVHEDPDALRLDRRFPKRHMGFGRGQHFCIGAPLARLEARVLLEELLSTGTKLEPGPNAPDHGRWARSIFIRRLEALDLRAKPA